MYLHGVPPSSTQSVVALLCGTLDELVLPAQQWHAGDVPLVGCVKGGLQLDVSHLHPFHVFLSI